MKSSYPGVVTADTIEVRFPFSGRVSAVNKQTGDPVKKGEWLASLDKKLLQTELDKELLEYDQVRAAFDELKQKGQEQNLQKSLEISVKNVELAKARLDAADLISPLDGIVLNIGSLLVGLNVTPSGNPIEIIGLDSHKFEFEITKNDLEKFLRPRKVLISFFKGDKDDIEAQTSPPIRGLKGKFKIMAKLVKSESLLPGLEGEARLINSI